MNGSINRLVLLVASLIAVASGPAIAQQPRFRVFDLGPLGFAPNLSSSPEVHGTIAINNWGQIVYTRAVGGEMHAWVYLPQDAFGQLEGFVDLNDEDNLDPTNAAAWDINMSGQIAGQFDGIVSGQGQAVVWQLGTTVTACPLGFLTQTDPWTVAYAINDASPSVVVGSGLVSEGPPCSQWIQRGFRAEFTFPGACPGAIVLEVLLPDILSMDRGTFARDVNTLGGAPDNDMIAGYSLQQVNEICGTEPCNGGQDALVWPPFAPLAPLDTLDPPHGGHEATGINNGGQIVGFGFNDVQEGFCLIHALFWQDESAPVTDLHLEGEVDLTQQTRANAINDRVPGQVVGENISTGRAFLWEQDGMGGWNQAVDLELQIDPTSGWELVSAHDVNDAGCVVGWGIFQGTTSAFMLYECPADCDGSNDAEVGINDFLALIAQWGQVGSSCDVDGGGVGISDFLALLASWGPCCSNQSMAPPQTVQDCINRFGVENPQLLEKCICAVEPEECPQQ